MRQPARIINSSLKRWQWLIVLLSVTTRQTMAQYASSTYNGQFGGYSQQQLEQLQRVGFPATPLTYTREYPSAVQSIWSGAPIVVNDEARVLGPQRQRQEQGYLPINYYNNRETYASVESEGRNPSWIDNNNDRTPPTRAANHNYNNGYLYQTQPQYNNNQQQELEQRELLAVADSRREEEQIVRIGGSRSLADNVNNNNNNNGYFDPGLSLRHRDFEARYAKHYSDYLRRYPQRLQPFYSTGPSFVDK